MEPVVRNAMRAQGIDVELAVTTNSLVIATKEDAFLRYGAFDPERMPTFWADVTAEATRQGSRRCARRARPSGCSRTHRDASGGWSTKAS